MANEEDGGLTKYAKTLATDTVNQFNAQYNRSVSEDLNMTWFQYTGSLLTTSRPFCKALVDKRYFHISEIDELLKGNIGGKTVHLNSKTGLPDGMIEGTNEQSFFINRGGYGCGHQIFPVPLANVPETIVDVNDLATNAKSVKDELSSATDNIISETESIATPINFKSKDSILRKANDEYGGDVSQVKDAVRNTIIGDRENIPDLLDAVKKEFGDSIINYKHQSADNYMGYSGDLFNIRFSNGTIGEMQVNTAKMIYAKESPASAKKILGEELWNEINKDTGLDGGLGHKYYEEYRLTTTSIERKMELKRLSEEYYSHFID